MGIIPTNFNNLSRSEKITRGEFLKWLGLSFCSYAVVSCRPEVPLMVQEDSGALLTMDGYPEADVKTQEDGEPIRKIYRTDGEWKKILSPEQYQLMRQKGTEIPFTGIYNNFFEKGKYLCVCCDNELFSSETKFKSKEGWPAFWAPVSDRNISTSLDERFGLVRMEVKCSRCDSHLGHVFNDGPPPSGMRFCINSGALKFVEDS